LSGGGSVPSGEGLANARDEAGGLEVGAPEVSIVVTTCAEEDRDPDVGELCEEEAELGREEVPETWSGAVEKGATTLFSTELDNGGTATVEEPIFSIETSHKLPPVRLMNSERTFCSLSLSS